MYLCKSQSRIGLLNDNHFLVFFIYHVFDFERLNLHFIMRLLYLISLLMVHKFEPINQLLFLLKSSEKFMLLDDSKGDEI